MPESDSIFMPLMLRSNVPALTPVPWSQRGLLLRCRSRFEPGGLHSSAAPPLGPRQPGIPTRVVRGAAAWRGKTKTSLRSGGEFVLCFKARSFIAAKESLLFSGRIAPRASEQRFVCCRSGRDSRFTTVFSVLAVAGVVNHVVVEGEKTRLLN